MRNPVLSAILLHQLLNKWQYPHKRRPQWLLNHMHVDRKHWTLFYVAVQSYKIHLENGRNVTFM